MARRYGFGKAEKLKRRKDIEILFASGKQLMVFPLRLSYRVLSPTAQPGVKAGVAVSKKHFKKAVDRNRIKRLLREAYRLQKLPLAEVVKGQQKELHLFVMYSQKEMPRFAVVYAAMGRLLKKLVKELNENANAA